MFQDAVVTLSGGVVRQRRQRKKVGLDDVAGQDRHDADQEQRNHRGDPEDLGGVRGAQNAAVLNELDREQDDGAEDERRR